MNKKSILKKRGTRAFAEQLNKAGGTYTVDEVSHLLDIPKIEVEERTGSELIGVQFQGGIAYPRWQFNGNNLVEHFTDIMAMLNTDSSIGKVQFFLTKDKELGKSIIDVLNEGNCKELSTVKILAKQFYQQIAR